MKKRKIAIAITALLLCVGIVAGFKFVPSEEQALAENFLNTFYTVSDYDLHMYLKDNPKGDEAISSNLAKQKYQSYFTEKGCAQFIGDKIYYAYEELAYDTKSTLSLNSLVIREEFNKPDEYLKGYTFTAQIAISYADGQTKTVTQEGKLQILSKNGDSKIDFISILGREQTINEAKSVE